MSLGDAEFRLKRVPLFPLPTAVLLPRAVLPLHIFEPRYREMTADALAGDGQIAMVLLRPGWEKDYYGRPAIEPVVCVGQIISHESLPDGKYNFLLQGTLRARIIREHSDDGRAYRTAELQPLAQTQVLEIDLERYRQRLVQVFSRQPLASTGLGKQFLQMLSSPLPTADLCDLVAFNLLEDVALKQDLLADGDVLQRVKKVVELVDGLRFSRPPDGPSDARLN
jgi:uncharacterized protein